VPEFEVFTEIGAVTIAVCQAILEFSLNLKVFPSYSLFIACFCIVPDPPMNPASVYSPPNLQQNAPNECVDSFVFGTRMLFTMLFIAQTKCTNSKK
jgi:hypothetical protein